MTRRPVCLCCLLFLLLQMILIRGFQVYDDREPPWLEALVQQERPATVEGQIYQKEIKEEYDVFYLKCSSLQSKIIIYIKRESPEDLQKQSQKEQHKQSQEQSQKKQQKQPVKDLNINVIHIGNRIRVTGEASLFDVPRNPGNFDQNFYYRKQGIQGAVWADSVEVTDTEIYRLRDRLSQIRQRWKELLIEILGEEKGNTMSAILLGEKSGLDAELKELYQITGIGHILAISGLHMSFIGIGLYKLLRRGGFSFFTAGMAGTCFLLCYTIMIGCGVASVRALVMYGIRMGAEITGRVYDMLTSLAIAAMVILIWRPLYLLDAGFLLSFGAVAGALLLSPVLEQALRVEDESAGGMAAVQVQFLRGLCSGLGIHLMIFPVMLYFYYEFPPYSILLNLLVIPLMSAVLGAGVTGSFLSAIFLPAGRWVLHICVPILWLYEKSCRLTMALPFCRLVFGRPVLWQILLYYLVLLFLWMVLKYTKKKTGRQLGVVLMAAVVCVLAVGHGNRGKVRFTMLDVGQGDGMFLRGPSGVTYLIDGGSSDVKSVGRYRIEPFLKSQGVGVLDYVFVSHGDADHMNGIEEMIERQSVGVKVRCLVLPVQELWDENLTELAQTAADRNTRVLTIRESQCLTEGTMTLTCLQPDTDFPGEIGNASSVVLKLSYGAFDMLLTGDVEGAGEDELEKNPVLGECEVLKVAHHGSKNSSSETMLNKIRPEVSLISAGRENRYGHPHADTIDRLENVESRIFCTQELGAITIISDGTRMTLHHFVEE
ncbi:DNA internalization-related competence protein ComEC/Rec2 [Hespellia stercorisuis]|uniref:Competence protein ComEC n=1 Tax=Hespellia stercorisuis DSM 15480 TaxID=1121950 RepID=A0A1M6MPT5_9FIRM|nr:DNA internalization-related competence protein ComEC/Rec2 [Hespellia stercorisuis]SHJ85498.1 competence protein ComEC [Hespellia stercorisuis DSM 15480]